MDPALTAAAIGVSGTVIVGVAGFWANARNTNKTPAVTRRAIELAGQGQVTDRYTKAIEQLGSDKLDVRTGGIYALERVVYDSPRDHPTVMEVLATFVREYSHEPLQPPSSPASGSGTRPDVQAAVTVIGHRNPKHDRQWVNLTGANLITANLTSANLYYAYLIRANLSGADLTGADLAGANLINPNLYHANLYNAYLIDANLYGGAAAR